MTITSAEKATVAQRIARAVTDAYSLTNEMPDEAQLMEAIIFVLDEEQRKGVK